MVHADHRRHHRQVLADARGLILLTGATGYIGSRLLREIEAGGCNRRLNERGLEAMTTAGPGHHYPPRRRLTVSYAGHPMGWLFRADTGAWARLCEPVPPPEKPGLIDLPIWRTTT